MFRPNPVSPSHTSKLASICKASRSSAAMATRNIRFEFNCERMLTFHHDLPSRLIGAAGSAVDPGYRQAYVSAMAPIMQKHTDECIAASQPKCSVCESRPTKQVLTTPMSFLHIPQDPFVAVIVTPVCEKPGCNTQGEANVNAMLAEITGMTQDEAAGGTGGSPKAPTRISRNAHCPCGSSRKYKKCCGVEAGGD